MYMNDKRSKVFFPEQCLHLGVLTSLRRSGSEFRDFPLSEVAPGSPATANMHGALSRRV